MFSIGDKVVYPMHGAGTIESIEQKEMLGNKEDYYIIKMPVGDMKLMVPTKKAKDIGVRNVVSKEVSDGVFNILSKPKDPYVHDTNWSKRYAANVDKIKSGDIYEVAEVVRELSHRHMERGLSIGEKKMLSSAKDILLSEMCLAENEPHDLLDLQIEEKIKESFDIVNEEENEDQGIINKV